MFDTLPAPRVPASPGRLPDPEILDDLRPGSGEPIRQAKAIIRETNQAVADLESARPGPLGTAWGEAMTADAQALMATGTLPKVSKVEALARGDLHRWSVASAMARTLIRRAQAAIQPALDDEALLNAAQARLAEVQDSLGRDAAVAYAMARKDQAYRADAWRAYESAKGLTEEATRLRGLVAWLDGRDRNFDPWGWGAGWGAETAGFMLGCEDLLEGARRLTIPQGVTWPTGHPLAQYVVGPQASTALLSGQPYEVPGSDE